MLIFHFQFSMAQKCTQKKEKNTRALPIELQQGAIHFIRKLEKRKLQFLSSKGLTAVEIWLKYPFSLGKNKKNGKKENSSQGTQYTVCIGIDSYLKKLGTPVHQPIQGRAGKGGRGREREGEGGKKM